MKLKNIIIIALALVSCLTVSAKKKKILYGSKNQIINVAGDVSELTQKGFEEKFNVIKPAMIHINSKVYLTETGKFNAISLLEDLNSQKAGLRMAEQIFPYSNGAYSYDKILNWCAQNSSNKEIEDSEESLYGLEDLKDPKKLAEVLDNTYFFYATKKDAENYRWAVYKVVFSDEAIQRIYNNEPLDRIDLPVVFVAQGKGKVSEKYNKLLRNVGKKAPAFAVRGDYVKNDKRFHPVPDAITDRYGDGAYAEIGRGNGVLPKDRFYIYRTKAKKDGTLYSKKIGTVRAAGISNDYTKIQTIAGGFAKRGDVAVLSQDHKQSSNIMFGYQNKSLSINYQHESLLTMNRHGLSQYLLIRAGGGFFTPSEDKLKEGANYIDGTLNGCVPTEWEAQIKHLEYWEDTEGNKYMRYFDNFKKPIFFHVGFGYGASWQFAHMFELMPYVMVEAEFLTAEQKDHELDTKDEPWLASYGAFSVRTPLGVKFNINLDKSHRSQLFVGAEYNLVNLGINPSKNEISTDSQSGKKSDGLMPYKWWDEGVAKPNHMRRTGMHIYAGLRFNF